MTITGNEVAVDNQMRRAEKQSQSPVNRLLESADTATGAISIAAGSAAIGSIAKAIGIAKRFTSGLGVATLDENLEHLGDATETALSRVEKNLEAQGERIEEIERRLNSEELLEGIKAATLQAQRTKDKKRLERMALILANGVAENDLEPESLDDMMRAAVELTNWDILVLGKMYDSQKGLLSGRRSSFDWSEQVGHIWTDWNRLFGLGEDQHLKLRASLSRLQSLGLIAEAQTNFVKDGSLGRQAFGLLLDGKRLYERLQEIEGAH
ncbi:MAG: hypothetical protein ABSB50_01515 [Terracidiphilus sp.]